MSRTSREHSVGAKESSSARRKSQAEISRQEILRQIFGNVGELMDDFSCAVESTVLLHGRMYITDRFACFYSNLFGLEKKIRIPFSHITVVTKENTALVIPNAIAISTFKKQYIFRSFWDRDHCFFMLKSFISKYSHASVINEEEAKHMKHANYSIKSSSQPVFDDMPDSILKDDKDDDADTIPDDTSSLADSITDDGEGGDNDEVEEGEEHDLQNLESPDSSEEAFIAEVEKVHLKVDVLQDKLALSVADFYSFFVDNKAPHSWLDFHEKTNDEQLSVTAWENLSASGNDGLGKRRELKFFKPVNLPGLKNARGVKLQHLKRYGSHGLIVRSSTHLEDVPASDTFSVEDCVTVKHLSEKSVEVTITFEVKFVKSTFIRYIIESNTTSEMTKWLHSIFDYWKTSSLEKLKDRDVKLASIKKVLKPVTDDSDDEDGDSPKGASDSPLKRNKSMKVMMSVKKKAFKSVKAVTDGVSLHMSDSLESWQRVEGRRFFVLCFAVIFGTGLSMYIKLRAMTIQIELLNEKIDLLLAHR